MAKSAKVKAVVKTVEVAREVPLPSEAAAILVDRIVEAECLTKGNLWFCFRKYNDGTCECLHGRYDGSAKVAKPVVMKRFNRKERRHDALRDKLLGPEPENGFKVLWAWRNGEFVEGQA